MAITTNYAVNGMTCGHCVSAVTEELTKIAGVTAVNVDLESKTVSVQSEHDIEAAAVQAAIDEAGFELVSS